MSNFRYTLEKYKGRNSRFTCPSCGKHHKFTRYIDTATSQYLHPDVGRCDREDRCGYHYKAKDFLADNNIEPVFMTINRFEQVPPKQASYMQDELMWRSIQLFAPNHFLQYMGTLFGAKKAKELATKYRIGTAKHWYGATVFWQVDAQGNSRAGKVMLYNPLSGKRDKTCISWAHHILKMKDYNLEQCLFGEHLLSENPAIPVALVESEKTAVIASQYLPQFLWLAVGGKHGLKQEKLQVLMGREVTLFPDLNGYEMWSAKASELSWLATFTVSDLIEKVATEEERKQGLDLADFLIKGSINELIQVYSIA